MIIMVSDQGKENFKNILKLDRVVHACNPSNRARGAGV